MDLADSIKRLRELYNRFQRHGITVEEYIGGMREAIQTINQLVELVAEMRDASAMVRKGYVLALDKGDLMQANMKICMPAITDALTKADALLNKLGDV